MTHDHVETIKQIYGAFGRGDVGAILELVSDQTEWGFNVLKCVPWHATVRGRQALPQFFTNLAEMDIQTFEPQTFLKNDDHVAALVHIDYTVRKSGRRVTEDQIHLWRFDEMGKVTALQHFEDTAQVIAAYAG